MSRHVRVVTGRTACWARWRSKRRFLRSPIILSRVIGAFALALVVRPVPGQALLLGGKLGFELLARQRLRLTMARAASVETLRRSAI